MHPLELVEGLCEMFRLFDNQDLMLQVSHRWTNLVGSIPLPRPSRFTGMAPHTAGPDWVQRSFGPASDGASRYRMVYTYLPLHGAEKSRQEFTDGVVFRDETTGIQKSTTRRYHLPPVRPPRELLVLDSEPTPIATTPHPSTSSTAVRAMGATAVPLINETDSKAIVKDAKNSVIKETLNKNGFHDSSSWLTLVKHALTDACSLIITEDRSIKLWVQDNISKLYKAVITPMSTILNCFKQAAQDLVKILYELQLSIWTDLMAQIDHNKSTVDFLTGNDSINYIFGDEVRCFHQSHEFASEVVSVHVAACGVIEEIWLWESVQRRDSALPNRQNFSCERSLLNSWKA
ncbi:hypothetical protein BD769DRAFT_1389297 [Suillus cothurnatus]|nr:hypothetical protein BD769DRAFT_1389297 [Suillus cothurnatus]